jgi:glutamyl-Q tRNA(Asp) synthetase
VVVDDADQGITDVVRGADLLDSTAWQIELQRALGLAQPRYAHLPVVTAPDGAKLAKSRCSVPPDLTNPDQVLLQALVLLRQRPPAELAGYKPAEVLKWAISNWKPANLEHITAVAAL